MSSTSHGEEDVSRAGMNSLPLEVILMILGHVECLDDNSIFQCTQVCSTWSSPSLALLYKHLFIYARDAKRLLDSAGLGKWRTRTLTIRVKDEGESTDDWTDDLGSLIHTCASELKVLRLESVRDVPTDFFLIYAFPQLEELCFHAIFARNSPSRDLPENTRAIPFNPLPLTSLELGLSGGIYESLGIAFLVGCLLAARVNRLAIVLLRRTSETPALTVLRRLASYTYKLCILLDPELLAELPNLTSPALRILQLHDITNAQIRDTLPSLRSGLWAFALSTDEELEVDTCREMIKSFDEKGWEDLQLMTVVAKQGSEVESRSEGKQLAEGLRKRGVHVQFHDVSRY